MSVILRWKFILSSWCRRDSSGALTLFV